MTDKNPTKFVKFVGYTPVSGVVIFWEILGQGQSQVGPKTRISSKMRSTRSAKQVALKRLSSSFDKSDTSDNSDNSDNPEEERNVFKEEDIVLVEYDEPCKPASSKKGRNAKGSKGGKTVLQDSGFEEDFDENEVAEAIMIDFDTPIRKLQTESKIFLKNIDTLRIPEIITEREMLRFARLERMCRANLKRQSMDEMMEEEVEEEKRSEETSTLKEKPVKRVRFE